MSAHRHTVLRLTESAIMLAFAAVLSVIKIIDMPYGGSVTACSMLPLLIITYRYGTRWGLLTSLTYGLIQMLLGMDNLSYATGFLPVAMIILFDYLVAFSVLGLGGLFRRKSLSQGTSLALASLVTGLLRYLCHACTGFTVWADASLPFRENLIFSLSYNAAYMLPEILILMLGAVYLSRFLSFDGEKVSRAPAIRQSSPAALVLSVVAKTVLAAAVVWIIILVAPAMQFTDGTLFLRGLASVNWAQVGGIAAIGLLFGGSIEFLSRRLKQSHR